MINRRQIIGAAAGLVGTSAVSAATASLGGRQPNFVVILCDDLGYGDVGPDGGRTIRTPHIDRMAREGITLTDYYAPANLCTPSRAGLLTGRYPIRTGLSRVLLAGDTIGLPQSEVTIPEALKSNYASALIGKWHLGHVAPYWPPSKQGFDLFYGIPYSHDILPLQLFEDDGKTLNAQEVNYHTLQQQFCARAERFMEERRDQPFYLELALSAPHLPNYPYKDFAGKSAAGAYGDVVEEADSIVGRVLAKIRQLGLDRNTLVILTSDNGPWFEGSTGGMRQRKGGGAYDGGYRTPFIARWPGHIAPNTRSDAIVSGVDLLPTFCAMAGLPLPAGVDLDGLDITTVLTRRGASPHEEIVLFDYETVVGIRTQKWKYISADYFRSFLMLMDGRGYPQLYDTSDKREEYSVASLHPDVVHAMQARLKRAGDRFARYRTSPDPLAIQAQHRGPQHVPEIWQD